MGENVKPADFFLSSRQVFGLLIPGAVWIAAAALIAIDKPLKSLLLYAGDANVIGALAFLAVAHIVGTLLQYPSMQAVERATRLWQPYVPEGVEGLRTEVRKTIRQGYSRSGSPALYGVLPAEDDRADHESQHELFALCKRSVLSRSPELSRRLLEHEDEINLIGLLVLPFTFLCASLAFRAHEFSTIYFRGNTIGWQVTIGVAWAFITWYLVRSFRKERAEEYRSGYITFLLLERGLVRGGSAEDRN